jgi:hypothetical protein
MSCLDDFGLNHHRRFPTYIDFVCELSGVLDDFLDRDPNILRGAGLDIMALMMAKDSSHRNLLPVVPQIKGSFYHDNLLSVSPVYCLIAMSIFTDLLVLFDVLLTKSLGEDIDSYNRSRISILFVELLN